MTQFRLVPALLTPEESNKLFNILNAGKVKEGHINLTMFKSL